MTGIPQNANMGEKRRRCKNDFFSENAPKKRKRSCAIVELITREKLTPNVESRSIPGVRKKRKMPSEKKWMKESVLVFQ